MGRQNVSAYSIRVMLRYSDRPVTSSLATRSGLVSDSLQEAKVLEAKVPEARVLEAKVPEAKVLEAKVLEVITSSSCCGPAAQTVGRNMV